MTLADWIIGALVFAVLAAAFFKVMKDRKSGAECGCGCSSCANCPPPKQDAKQGKDT